MRAEAAEPADEPRAEALRALSDACSSRQAPSIARGEARGDGGRGGAFTVHGRECNGAVLGGPSGAVLRGAAGIEPAMDESRRTFGRG